MAEGASIGDGWSLGGQALLHLGVIVVFPCGYGLLALWTAFVVFVLLALTEQVVGKITYLYGLIAFLTEVYHWTG